MIALVLAPALAGAQELGQPSTTEGLAVQVELEAPKDGALSVGTRFHLVITARHTPGGIALLPEPLDLGGALAERRSERRHVRQKEGALELDVYRLQLVAFEPGEHTIPPIPLALGSTQAATRPITVTVTSGLSEDELMVASATIAEAIAELDRMAAPNPAPRSIEVADRRPLWAAAAVLAAAAIALAVASLARRRKRVALVTPPPVPLRPAHEIALERLAALAASGWLAKGEHKRFHVELSEILRGYAGARWSFDSLELTVSELMEELERRGVERADRDGLRRVLDLSDLVKFAKLEPPAEESLGALEAARALVEKTRTQPEAPVEAVS